MTEQLHPSASQPAPALVPLMLPNDDPSRALLDRIDAFVARTPGMSDSRFGEDATGERGLVKSIRDGRSPSIKITNKLLAFIAEQDAANSAAGVAGSPDSDAVSIGEAA